MKKTDTEKLEALKSAINSLCHEWSTLADGLVWLNGLGDESAKALRACSHDLDKLLKLD